MKTPEQRQWSRSGDFIVNFENTSRLLTVSIADFQIVNVCREESNNPTFLTFPSPSSQK